MRIEYLCENKQYVDTVATWIYNEFVDGVRPGISFNKVVHSFNERKKDTMPITILALNNEKCIGVASLVVNDLKARNYTPWLAGLYVNEEYRNNGVGKVLIEEIQDITKRVGFNRLYLRTEYATEYYKKLSWNYVEKVVDEYNLETNVFFKNLETEA